MNITFGGLDGEKTAHHGRDGKALVIGRMGGLIIITAFGGVAVPFVPILFARRYLYEYNIRRFRQPVPLPHEPGVRRLAG
mgnify:CR=1 FL=1